MADEKLMMEVEKLREESVSWYKDWEFAGEEVWIPGRECPIRCRVYQPEHPVSERMPVFFDVHGGGWAVHKCEVDQPFCLKVAERLGILVVSVDYRLAPEYQFPAPTHDVFDVIAHFYKNAELYCIDPLRMGIGGHSAGGQISVSVALYAKEMNAFPLRCMILDYPGVGGSSFEKEIEMQGELTKYQKEFLAMCDIFNRCKFAPEEYSQDYHCFPICASREQLHGLPPAVVTACEDDLLRFQDIEFARMLMEAGVETTFRLFEGVVHGFTADLYYTPEAEECHQMMIMGLEKYLLG